MSEDFEVDRVPVTAQAVFDSTRARLLQRQVEPDQQKPSRRVALE